MTTYAGKSLHTSLLFEVKFRNISNNILKPIKHKYKWKQIKIIDLSVRPPYMLTLL